MLKRLKEYIKACPVYKKAKPDNQKLLSPLMLIKPLIKQLFTIYIDFVIALPLLYNSYNAIITIINHLTK
jgi:hypothetical protein